MSVLTRRLPVGFAVFAILFAVVCDATAQGRARTVVGPMEIYPPHIRVTLEQHRAAMLPGSVGNSLEAQGVFNRSKLWQAGQVLRVCFFNGLADTRSRMARIAKQWEKAGNIFLDFGDVSIPRLCRPNEVNDIRIGYEYKGYWSLVGQDGVNFSRQTDQSMNFEYFNVEPPAEPEFTRLVLHEFGHAIGLQHEHQNPKSVCESEFDWDAIYAALAAPPNGWDRAKVDFNMRRLLNDGDVRVIGDFDKRSIMLYTFPDWMYRNGAASPCYFTSNVEASDGDRATVADMYPPDPATARLRRMKDVRILEEKLSNVKPAVRERALQNLELLNSGKSGQFKFEALQNLNSPTAQ